MASSDHPEWGEDRIALELRLKLGVEHSASTVRRYMVEDVPPMPRSTWRSFLKGHASEIRALDLVTASGRSGLSWRKITAGALRP